MTINTSGYNIPHVVIPTISSGTKTEVGTSAEFTQLWSMCNASGIARVTATLDDSLLDGTALVNFYPDGTGMEFAFITAAVAGTATPILAQLTIENSIAYCTVLDSTAKKSK